MRKAVGEYNSCLKKLYGSLRKRFNLDYEETLEVVDKVFEEDDFKDYSVILISNDDTYSNEFIKDINVKGVAQAYGFYREGEWAYESVQAVRDIIPGLLDDNTQKFMYVSVDIRSFFRLAIPGTICIKQGKNGNELTLDIIKTRRVIANELIRGLVKDDLLEFNNLLNKLYVKRWKLRPDIFYKGYKLTSSELSSLCDKSRDHNAIVCVKDGRIVGFIIYKYEYDCDNRAYERTSILTVKDIYVEEEYRRQGIATRMFEEVLRALEKFKSRKMKFKVWDDDFETKMFVASLQPKTLYTLYELDI